MRTQQLRRVAGPAPFGLKKAAAWLHSHPLAVELLALAEVSK